MELTQLFPGDLARQTIQALDDRVIVEHKAIVHEYREEYEWRELSAKVITGRTSDRGWTNMGGYFLTFTVFVSVIFVFTESIWSVDSWQLLRVIILTLLSFSLVTFALRLVKYNFVAFYTIRNEYAFLIKLSERDREAAEGIVSYIRDKIGQAHSAEKVAEAI
jgi:hypothetical protein